MQADNDNDADSDSDESDDEVRYSDSFHTEQLSRIVKVAGLGDNIQVYVNNGLPMMFRTNVGTLGRLSIYIKSKTLIDEEGRPTPNMH